jgi:Mlc titration factor MtfA (ptsG expression regulator)
VWRRLSGEQRERLEGIALDLLIEKRWEAANGFDLTDEIRVRIAAQAAVLVLGLPDDSYHRVRSIIVHPTTLVLRGEHSQVPGLVSDAPVPLAGLTESRGTVVIVWDVVQNDARHSGRGHNVVFHEFAHQLDMLDGTVDGTPPLTDQDQFDRWVEVCTRIYHQVASGQGGAALSTYAGVNAGEFFAVATEVFFDNPSGLRHDHQDLYDVLAEYYRQDPMSWPG